MSRRKKFSIWLIIILVIAGGVYYFIQSRQPKIEYTTEAAKRGDLFQTVSVTGKLKSKVQADLAFEINGKVKKINIETGDKVEKEQLLAQIDGSVLFSQFREAQAALDAQKQKYKLIKRKENTYSKEERRSQKATVEQYEAAAVTAQKQFSRISLYSPINGIVTKKEIEIGENVSANASVITVAGEGELEIEANVPESDIIKIQPGQKAEITLDAFPSDDKFSAGISEIEPASTVIQDVVYYKVKLKPSDVDSRFKSGMSADIDIRTAEKNNVIFIPLRAVKTENDKEYVEILKTQDGKEFTEKIYVKTGLKGDEGMVKIISGLSEGEKVITFTKTE